MRREQRRQSSRIASRHAAFCADAIDTGKAPGGGKPRLIPGRGYGDTDAFYESAGHTSAFWTCNQWVASRLRLAGVRAPLWSPFPTALTRRYRPVER